MFEWLKEFFSSEYTYTMSHYMSISKCNDCGELPRYSYLFGLTVSQLDNGVCPACGGENIVREIGQFEIKLKRKWYENAGWPVEYTWIPK